MMQTRDRRLPLLPEGVADELGWMPYGWLVYLPSFWVDPFQEHASAGTWASVALGTALFLVLYFRSFWESGWRLAAVAAAIAGLGFLFWPGNPGALVFFIYGGASLGIVGPPRRSFALLGVLVALVAAQALWIGYPWWLGLIAGGFALLIGAMNVHWVENARRNADLRRAREEIERLAKVAERERIGRDLHDLLGHTLSVIVLKSELASKLAGRDPERAAAEIREVEAISREGLRQVRQAVRGFRPGEASLRDESENARRVLAAAGIEAEIDVELDEATPSVVDRVAALAVREGVTNVIRHASASRCRVTARRGAVGMEVEIADDGGAAEIEEGNGLRGMRERVEAAGGSLDLVTDQGVALRIVLPLSASPEERP